MPDAPSSPGLFEAFGIELEYMIVDAEGLDVRPLCDRVLEAVAGPGAGDAVFDDTAWSNELVAHVIELKTAAPAPRLAGLAEAFQRDVRRINELLAPSGARLMPGPMHPWMDPATETRLWPHGGGEIYRTFDAIFGCRGHGWSNLQSMHVNLPFRDDAGFGRLHAAVRLVLPILPALAAGSPIVDARITGLRDSRLVAYRTNCARIPSITGRVIPEPVFTEEEYRARILEPIYRDTAPYDPEGILACEWANARGAIARFERRTIEIRVLDVQECPAADLAVAAATVAAIRLLAEETWCPPAALQAWPVDPLGDLLEACIRDGEDAVIGNAAYLKTFGLTGVSVCTAGQLWRHLVEQAERRLPGELDHCREALTVLLEEGPLATRILRITGQDPPSRRHGHPLPVLRADHSPGESPHPPLHEPSAAAFLPPGAPRQPSLPPAALRRVAEALCACLDEGRMLHADPPAAS